MADIILELSHINKRYSQGERRVTALADLNLSIKHGDNLAVIGPSGCGKSTLIRTIAGLIKVDSGQVRFKGEDISQWSELRKGDFRNKDIGIVVQDYALIDHKDVFFNVSLPFAYAQKKYAKSEKRALVEAALSSLDIADLSRSKVGVLSGGQRQRVAIARAIVMQPSLVLADEPTGALDSRNGEMVMSLLESINQSGTAILLATHNMNWAKRCHRILEMKDGQIVATTTGD